tara:strand:- start:6003 stop:6926 length:924 start_codon:yes stop_codon:yes gene_type:complete
MYDIKKLDLLKKSLVDSHHNNAFLMGLISSGLASIGLATNSATTILGSMLLSPIGALITKNIIYTFLTKQNYKLDIKYKKWFLQVCMVLLLTLLLSYIFGKIFQKIKNPFTDEELTKDWPTNEMKERANPINAIYMVFIALLCGVALPIALLHNSGVKLVAIGIATALIPPIANIGLSFSLKKNEKNKEFKKKAVITGISIFIINCVLLWLPSKFMLKEITKKNNIFKFIENVFIFPQILFKLNKYKYFIDADKDGDGKIDYKEFSKYHKKHKSIKSEQKIKTYFKSLDKNDTGDLSIREFLEIKKE